MKHHTLFNVVVLIVFATSVDCKGQGEEQPAASAQAAVVRMTVDLRAVQHQMAGGIGASWHAMSREFRFDKPPQFPRQRANQNARGSGWGGNPPLTDKQKWQRIEELGSWLGMDFMRVELEQRMYEPERDRFDWDNEEMQALYRILDWCERGKVDVFLTQMWSFVDWNAYEGVPPLQSAPRDTKDFAVGLATLAQHLVKQKGYACVKWLCIANEPGQDWSWWLGPGSNPISITPALKEVRAELDKRGIPIALSAPDYNNIKSPQCDGYDFDPYVGAYDCHCYSRLNRDALMKAWVTFAHSRNKPFFLTEMGDFGFGWKDSNRGPASYHTALSIADMVISGLAIGVDAFNRWSFTNRGDLDGQFQLIRTWDIKGKRYVDCDQIVPDPVPYYSYAMLTRFQAKHSAILKTTVTGRGVVATALRSPKGHLTFLVLNKDNAEQKLTMRINGIDTAATLHGYQVTEADITQPDFKLEAKRVFKVSAGDPVFTDALSASSITVYSTYCLRPSDAGIVTD